MPAVPNLCKFWKMLILLCFIWLSGCSQADNQSDQSTVNNTSINKSRNISNSILFNQAFEYLKLADEIESESPSMSRLLDKTAYECQSSINYFDRKYSKNYDKYDEYNDTRLKKRPHIKHKIILKAKDDIWECAIYVLAQFDGRDWISKNSYLSRIADSLEKEGHHERAEFIREQGVKLAHINPDSYKSGIELAEIATSYINNKDFETAKTLITESLNIIQNLEDRKPCAPFQIASIYYLEKDNIDRVMKLVQQMSNEGISSELDSAIIGIVAKMVQKGYVDEATDIFSIALLDDSKMSMLSILIDGIKISSDDLNTKSILEELLYESENMHSINHVLQARMMIAEAYFDLQDVNKAKNILKQTIMRFNIEKMEMPYAPYVPATVHCLARMSKLKDAVRILHRYKGTLMSSNESIYNLLDEYFSVAVGYEICGMNNEVEQTLSAIFLKLDQAGDKPENVKIDICSIRESYKYIRESDSFSLHFKSCSEMMNKLVLIDCRFESVFTELFDNEEIKLATLSKSAVKIIDCNNNVALGKIIDILLDETQSHNHDLYSKVVIKFIYEEEYSRSIGDKINVDFSKQTGNSLMDFAYFVAQKKDYSTSDGLLYNCVTLARILIKSGKGGIDERLKAYILKSVYENEFTAEWKARRFIASMDVLYAVDHERTDETLDRLIAMPFDDVRRLVGNSLTEFLFILFEYRGANDAREYYNKNIEYRNKEYLRPFWNHALWYAKTGEYEKCIKLIDYKYGVQSAYIGTKGVTDVIETVFEQDGFNKAWSFVDAFKKHPSLRVTILKKIAELVIEKKVRVNFNKTIKPVILELLESSNSNFMNISSIDECTAIYYAFGRKIDALRLIDYWFNLFDKKSAHYGSLPKIAELYLMVDEVPKVQSFIENEKYKNRKSKMQLLLALYYLENNQTRKAFNIALELDYDVLTFYRKALELKLKNKPWEDVFVAVTSKTDYRFDSEYYFRAALISCQNGRFDEAIERICSLNYIGSQNLEQFAQIILSMDLAGYALNDNQKKELRKLLGYNKYFSEYPYDKELFSLNTP